jgi:hypothetical protein
MRSFGAFGCKEFCVKLFAAARTGQKENSRHCKSPKKYSHQGVKTKKLF